MTIKEIKARSNSLKPLIDWENIIPLSKYHIPPIGSLTRRDIIILDKTEKEILYRLTNNNEVRSFKRGSLFSKFLVDRKKF